MAKILIIDDEPLQMKAFQRILGEEEITLTEDEYYGSLGMDDVPFVRAAYERAGRELDDEKLRSLIERKTILHREAMKDGLPLFPGVVTFIKTLSRSYPLGLASMAHRTEIDYALERASLQPMVRVGTFGNGALRSQCGMRFFPNQCALSA